MKTANFTSAGINEPGMTQAIEYFRQIAFRNVLPTSDIGHEQSPVITRLS